MLLWRPATAAIDRYLLPAGPTAANPRQRDGMTDIVALHRPCRIYASSVSNDATIHNQTVFLRKSLTHDNT